MTGSPRGWAWRLAAAAVLLVAYFAIWSPVRGLATQQVVGPMIASASGHPMVESPHRAVVHFAGDERRWIAPAGLSFLIGASVILLASARLDLTAGLWGAHLAVGLLSAFVLVQALQGSALSGHLHAFIHRYLYDGITLVAMVLSFTVFRATVPSEAAGVGAPATADQGSGASTRERP